MAPTPNPSDKFLASVTKLNTQFLEFLRKELDANPDKLCLKGCSDYIREAAKLRLKFDDAFDDADEPVHQATTLLSVVPSSQTKTLYLIRHGEGYHNVGICNLDSRLTELGWTQAHAIRACPQLVVSSPLTRALETAVGAFGCPESSADGVGGVLMEAQTGIEDVRAAHAASYAYSGIRYVAHELCRERCGPSNCDALRERETLQREFPGFDFGLVGDTDTQWVEGAAETEGSVVARGLQFLQWVMAQPEREVAVVTHSAFLWFTLLSFGGDSSRAVKSKYQRWFENGEMRAVVLSDLLQVRGSEVDGSNAHVESHVEPQRDLL